MYINVTWKYSILITLRDFQHTENQRASNNIILKIGDIGIIR